VAALRSRNADPTPHPLFLRLSLLRRLSL
jgi:hypothetical protein